MLKTCSAASILAVLALATPLRAQSLEELRQERDTKACTALGAGPDTDGYAECLTKRNTDRFQEAQKRAADAASMPKGYRVATGQTLDPQTGEPPMKTGGLPEDLMYLTPSKTRAMQGAQPLVPKVSVKTETVCTTESGVALTPEAAAELANPKAGADATSPPAGPDAANAKANCRKTVEVTKEMVQAPRRDNRDDPTSSTARTYMHPGDIFNDHTLLTGPSGR